VFDEIRPIPKLPEGLREAALLGNLVPFIGAGVSRLAGCSSWVSFADNALRSLASSGCISHAQLAQIAQLAPRVKLSIARQLATEHNQKIDFAKAIYEDKGAPPASERGRRVYCALSKLAKTFVTTNYDQWLDREMLSISLPSGEDESQPKTLERRVIHQVAEFIPAILSEGQSTVVHLHGSILDPDRMIVTTRDYLRHYANDRLTVSSGIENKVLTFLSVLFRSKNVLFVGYGLEELEILEYVIQKAGRPPNNEGARHYILYGLFSHEQQVAQSLSKYYAEFGIEFLPYLKDNKDWDQLIDVLESYAEKMIATTPSQIANLKLLEDLLGDD